MLTLLKNCDVYAPEHLGMKDILVAGGRLALIADKLEMPVGMACEMLDVQGLKVLPGLIDAHVHIAGAGGEGGPATRTPEMKLFHMLEAGVTTVVGCLGTDGMTRSLESVLMKVKALRQEGVSAFMYTGAYQVPTPTITGDVGRDIALIDEIIGVGEIAISDHRSSYPNVDELLRLTEHARVGGMLGGKAGILNIHLGDAQDPFRPLYQVVEKSMLKLTQFLPTHCNRNDYTLEDAIVYARQGGNIDITTSSYPYFPEYEVKPSKCLRLIKDAGISLSQVTFTSDACGSLPGFDENGKLIKLEMGLPSANLREIRDAVNQEGITLDEAISVLTSNPARILKLSGKGTIAEGCDADLLFLDSRLEQRHLMSMGQWMCRDGKVLKQGNYA